MDPRAIRKSEARLRTAKASIDRMAVAPSHERFADEWYIFLTSLKNVYTLLETGAKSSAQSRQWFGRKAKERRGDQLLHYIFQARNDEDHGLGTSVNEIPGRALYGVRSPGFSNAILVNSLPGGGLDVKSLDGKPVLNRVIPRQTILVPVEALGNLTVNPPTTHLGRSLENNAPLTVARLAFSYLQDLVLEDSKLA